MALAEVVFSSDLVQDSRLLAMAKTKYEAEAKAETEAKIEFLYFLIKP
jgi:hypothetical protein